jgi:hypothetical protein
LNEEYGEGLMSKITDSLHKESFEFLGCIKIPLPHIPKLHTTTLLFGRECRVMVISCIPASLGTDGDDPYLNPLCNERRESKQAIILMIQKHKHLLDVFIKT